MGVVLVLTYVSLESALGLWTVVGIGWWCVNTSMVFYVTVDLCTCMLYAYVRGCTNIFQSRWFLATYYWSLPAFVQLGLSTCPLVCRWYVVVITCLISSIMHSFANSLLVNLTCRCPSENASIYSIVWPTNRKHVCHVSCVCASRQYGSCYLCVQISHYAHMFVTFRDTGCGPENINRHKFKLFACMEYLHYYFQSLLTGFVRTCGAASDGFSQVLRHVLPVKLSARRFIH